MSQRPARPLTILHTIETGGPGGAETLLVALASRMNPSDFRAVALVPPNSWVESNLASRGVRTVPLVSGRWFDPQPLLHLVGVIRSERVDLIHSHLPSQNFYGSVAGALTHTPSVTTYHGPIELEQSVGFKGRLRLAAVRKAASFYSVVSEQMCTALVEYGFDSEKILRVYNGVDVDASDLGLDTGLRGMIGVESETPIVGTVANIRSPKGYEYFVRAAKIVNEARPDVHFVSIGDKHPVLFAELEQLVKTLGLQNRITFVGFREDATKLLRDFNVFVLSSTSEGFPFAAVEAMAAGKASVMTRCGGPEEILDDGKTGFLVPTRDPNALAGRIIELLNSPDRAGAMGRAAREKVLRDFTVQGMLQAYEKLYRKLCADRAG